MERRVGCDCTYSGEEVEELHVVGDVGENVVVDVVMVWRWEKKVVGVGAGEGEG